MPRLAPIQPARSPRNPSLPSRRSASVRDLGNGLVELLLQTACVGLLGPPDHSLRSQMPHELLLEHASSLNEEAAVDRFVGDLNLRVSRVSPPLRGVAA